MWKLPTNARIGAMNVFSDSIRRGEIAQPDMLPDLRSADTLIVTSDYGGHHKGSDFETCSFLIIPLDCQFSGWEQRRLRIRRVYRLGKRRISYKVLNDRRRKEALNAFLSAVDGLPGLCVGVLVAKSVRTIFATDADSEPSDAGTAVLAGYSTAARERLLRVVHLVSLFVAGLSRPGQNVLWFTDEDEIAANPRRVHQLTEAFARVCGHYLGHDMGHLRCGTTACDDGSLQIEDLAAVPDMVAGALASTFTAYRLTGSTPTREIVAPLPTGIPAKTRRIAAWLADRRCPMKRLVYAVGPSDGGTGLKFCRMMFHGVDPPVLRR